MKPEKITKGQDGIKVPDNPIIPFIEGDGIGPDIWAAAVRVFDAAVEKAYNGKRRLPGKRFLQARSPISKNGEWLPQQTLDIIKEYLVAIKGPLTTPDRRRD